MIADDFGNTGVVVGLGRWMGEGWRERGREREGWLVTRWMHGSEERRSRRANRKKRER